MRVGWRRLALLAALVVLAGGVRWVAMRATDPVRLIGDENYYGMTALQIANVSGGRGWELFSVNRSKDRQGDDDCWFRRVSS